MRRDDFSKRQIKLKELAEAMLARIGNSPNVQLKQCTHREKMAHNYKVL